MIPQNEMGVIVEFVKQAMGTNWEIEYIQSEYPDAIIRNTQTGKTYRAEFEFMASNFIQHNHDIRYCDLIVCWINDWPNCLLPIWALSNWENKTIFELDKKDKEIAYLTLENMKLKTQNKALENGIINSRNVPGSAAEEMVLKAKKMKANGFGVSAIARHLFNSHKATGAQVTKVKKLLGEY